MKVETLEKHIYKNPLAIEITQNSKTLIMNNRGNDFRSYFSRPATTATTTDPRYAYGDDYSPYPSGQFGIDRRQGYDYGEGSLSPGNRLDHRLSVHPDYGDGNRFLHSRNRLFGLEHRRPSYRYHTRIGAPTEYRPFEESLAIRPFGHSSITTETPHLARIPPQVIIIGSSRSNDNPSPRFPNSRMMNTDTPLETDNESSKLTKEEQEQALKKLKKEIYNPAPNNKTPTRRVSLYYRDLNRDPNNLNPKNSNKDEGGKRCAVCLEDFEAKEQVMLTPCNHMFHEECIVPWVKSQGHCPVCRCAFWDKVRENVAAHNNGRAHGQFEDELFSLIRAVNEAFPWGA